MPNLGAEQAREMAEPSKRLNYQLCFTRGYGGDMKKHRVNVPQGGYEKTFTS